jgi:type IV secretion system protein VirB4
MMQLRRSQVEAARMIKREANVSRHINIIGHYDDTTLIDKDGKLIRLFSLQGIDAATLSQLQLDIEKNRRNSLWKHFHANFAVYFWLLREPAFAYPEGEFKQSFAAAVNERYRKKLAATPLYTSHWIMALVTKAPQGKLNKISDWFKRINHAANRAAQQVYLAKMHQRLEQATQRVLGSLQNYHIKALGTYKKNGLTLSEALTFIGKLINADALPVPLLKQSAASYLPRKRLSFNSRAGTIEARRADGSKLFGAVLAIKVYSGFTFAGILDSLNALPLHFTLTQSFRFFDSHAAKTKIKHQQSDLQQSRDESVSQTLEINESLDSAASGNVGYGLHHLTLLCWNKNLNALQDDVAMISATLSKQDIAVVREDVTCECGFWAQLPGNFAYIAREAMLSTVNLASLASLHNVPHGQLTGNYWGNAVTVLATRSGSPYYFNFHYKDVGNTLIIGRMGSGKTLVMGFLLLQSLKFGGKRVVFDKDRGLEILIRSLGGLYEKLQPGIPTGFNPCQLEDSPENRAFLTLLFKTMLSMPGKALAAEDEQKVEHAINTLYTLPSEDRRLQHLAPLFGVPGQDLRSRFDAWHSGHSKAWLFDNPKDSINLNNDVMGFELGAILEDPETKTPALMYLLYRVMQQLEGERGGIFIDEGWKALNDSFFKQVLDDLARTPRKKNNFLCLATQTAEDAVNQETRKTLQEAASCKIFFPNPSADYTTYVQGFGLTDHEYELIKSLPDDEHYFLLNFGRGKESVVARLPLEGLEDEIAVISGRESSLQCVDQLRAEVGNDPMLWLPLFHERRKG